MSGWFDRAFGAAVEAVGAGIDDVRAKLLDEGWFGRRTPEPHQQGDLLDRLYDRHPEFFSSEPQQHSPEQDHGIDR